MPEKPPKAQPKPTEPTPAPQLPVPTVTHVYVEKGMGFGVTEKRPSEFSGIERRPASNSGQSRAQ